MDEFALHRKRVAVAAKELGYGDQVVEKIKKTKTLGEIERIMISARKGGNKK